MSESYSIPVSGLKEGHHSFDFEVDRKFFDMFEESEIREGMLVAAVEVEKGSTLLELDIKITGSVSVCCDRCLEMFDYPVACENRLLVRFGDVKDDSDPEIITVARDEYDLNLKQYFYEFIYLALPIKRIHPDDATGKSTCDPVMLQKLKEHLIEEEIKMDPRWDELKKLMNNN